MIIYLKKFGTTLTSRQIGKEAFAAILPVIKTAEAHERIEIDFDGVVTFSPSWGDEFFRPLFEQFAGRVFLKASNNASVKATLAMLEKVYGKPLPQSPAK
ncbi:MAG: DUF4325 domain-containing protein [Patescibacteria group bacterium]